MISYTEYFHTSWVRQICTSLTREPLLLREVEGPGGEEDKAGQKVRRGYIVRVKASLNPLCIPWTMPGPMVLYLVFGLKLPMNVIDKCECAGIASE